MSSDKLLKGRRSIAGQVYVLTTVCLHRHRWFANVGTVACVTDQFQDIEQRGLAVSLAWVVMPDHVHWLLELKEGELSDVARRLKSSSGLALNRLQGRRGAVWQAGFYDHAVRTDASLRKHALYILGNPVRAGLTERIGEYPFAWTRWPEDR